MQKHLYFICPTDFLEPTINSTFKDTNYYYTSLGNSVVFDDLTTTQIKALIKKNNIRRITFVLSYDNSIVLDAHKNQYSGIKGLNHFYNHITKQKERSKVLWQMCGNQFSVLSSHLNTKIEELQHKLNDSFTHQVKVSGKIYNKQMSIFKNTDSNSIYRIFFCLN